ncbi:MAG: hypothetical protein ACNS64_09960 [Candidatus Halalkalibacterium sp. M3_1C_030]
MFERLKKLFSSPSKPQEKTDIPAIIDQIKAREESNDISLGRRIHKLSYLDLDLFLDRDITENYRVTVYRGRERMYSFSIFANQGNYDILEKGYARIINYLEGERKIADLPEDETIKGFFYGH